jgi:hypothetical protein
LPAEGVPVSAPRADAETRLLTESDLLYQKVQAAYDAVFRLWIELHYMSCGVKNVSEAVEKPTWHAPPE